MTYFLEILASETFGILIKATIILAIAILGTWLMRNMVAQIRHRWWSLSFLILLILPIAILFLPNWKIEVMDSVVHTSSQVEKVSAIESSADGLEKGGAAIAVTDRPIVVKPNPIEIFWWIWIGGLVVSLLFLFRGYLRYWSIVKTARPCEDEDILYESLKISKSMGMNKDIDILVSHKVPIPITGGWLQPRIILPETCSSWNDDERGIFLSHELIHVNRFDAFRHLLARLAISVYWFHPLAWLAAKMSVLSREQACDEAVLEMGVKSSTYAKYLMKVADKITIRHTQLSLGAVQKSQLEKRVLTILNANRKMKYSFAHSILLVALSGFGIALSFASPVPKVSLSHSMATSESLFEIEESSLSDSMTVVIIDSDMDRSELEELKNSLEENQKIILEYEILRFNDEEQLVEISVEVTSPIGHAVTLTSFDLQGKSMGFLYNQKSKELFVRDMKDIAKQDARKYYSRALEPKEANSSGMEFPEIPLRTVMAEPDELVEYRRDSTLFVVFDAKTSMEEIENAVVKSKKWGLSLKYLDWEFGNDNRLKRINYQVLTEDGGYIDHKIDEFQNGSKMGFFYQAGTTTLYAGDLSKSEHELARSAYVAGLLDLPIGISKSLVAITED